MRTPEGSVCLLPIESDCQSTNGLCNTGLVCASDQRCRVACVGAADCLTGQVCAQGVCADSSNVDISGLLRQGAGVGAACAASTDCNAPLTCVMGICHYSCTSTSVCPMPQSCVKALGVGVCQQAIEAGCDNTTGAGCTAGLACASDNRCRAACRSASDCTTGQVCSSGVCADPSDLSNGQLTPKPQPKLDAGAPTPDAAGDTYVNKPIDTGSVIPIGGSGGTGGTGGTGGARDAGRDASQTDTPATGGTSSLDANNLGETGSAGSGGNRDSALPDAAVDHPADSPTDQLGITRPEVTPIDLASGTGVYVAPLPDAGGGTPIQTGCGVPSSTPRYFCDDFEFGLSKWVVSGQDWAGTTAQARSGGGSVTESPNGNIASEENAAMTMMASVDLTGAVDPILVFWDKRSAYSNNTYVEASSDGGSTWSQLTYWQASYDDHSTWLMQQVPLSSFVGKKLKVRFRLYEDASTTYDGWYIDDVEIRENWPVDASGADASGCAAMSAPTSVRYFCDDFESGLSKWIVSGRDWNTTAVQTRSGSLSITESPDGEIVTDENAATTMARSVDLTGATSPVLVFWDKRSAYSNNAYVEASSDGGNTWAQLAYWQASYDDHSTWLMQQVPLSSFVGKKLKIRFRLDQDSTTTYDGWYIDDVEIREAN